MPRRPRAVLAVAALAVAAALAAPRPAAATPKRAVPDYDGRGDPPTTAGDVLIWIPRIVMSPLYLVSEYVVRRPLGWLVTTAEENDWPALLIGAFTTEDENAGIIPTLLVDFGVEAGFLTSFGFYGFVDNVGTPGHELRLRLAYAGDDWLQLHFTERYDFRTDGATRLELRGRYDRRKDWVFAGVGPGYDDEDLLARYGEDRKHVGLRFRHALGKRGWLDTESRIVSVDFFTETCCGDTSLGTRIVEGTWEAPAAYDTGYSAFQQDLEIAVDTRGVRPGSESGVRAELRGAIGAYIGDARPGTGWAAWGGALGGFVDVWNNRTLGLHAWADFREGIGDTVPFTELAFLGGERPMRGFVEGRLRGQSAVAFTFDYRWPVWVWLDGYLFYQLGNVFGDHLKGFSMGALRQSFGLGLRPADKEDHNFELLFAAGSEALEDGGYLTTFRIVFGSAGGF